MSSLRWLGRLTAPSPQAWQETACPPLNIAGTIYIGGLLLYIHLARHLNYFVGRRVLLSLYDHHSTLQAWPAAAWRNSGFPDRHANFAPFKLAVHFTWPQSVSTDLNLILPGCAPTVIVPAADFDAVLLTFKSSMTMLTVLWPFVAL